MAEQQQQQQQQQPQKQQVVRVTVKQGSQEQHKEFRRPALGSFVERKLEQQFGPGELLLHDAVLAATEELQPSESYVFNVFAGAGGPRLYKDIILHVPGGPRGPEEFVRPYPLVSRATLHKVLDRLGCDMVQAPGTDTPVDFVALELQDNMLLTGLRYCVPWEARVSTLEGFALSSVKGFEEDATEAVLRQVQQQHGEAAVLPIRHIHSVDGRSREVDGAVVADGCAAILEAKQVLDDAAVSQLSSCIDFIRDSELRGPAAQLKGKKLLGFLAGRTLSSDPGKVERLVRDCRQHGYGIFVSNGQSLSLGNSRVPRLRVDCAMCRRAGAPSSPMRMLL